MFGYTGQQFDPETGLNFDNARYYDPSTGRFLSQDPSGFPAGDPNLYCYVGNNPTDRLNTANCCRNAKFSTITAVRDQNSASGRTNTSQKTFIDR